MSKTVTLPPAGSPGQVPCGKASLAGFEARVGCYGALNTAEGPRGQAAEAETGEASSARGRREKCMERSLGHEADKGVTRER